MLTIFCLPKPFQGRNAELQRAAFASWARLEPRPEILVFGDDQGVAEAAAEIGARHIPEIDRNEHGTPLVNSIFDKTQQLAANKLICYINSDIVLMSDFSDAIKFLHPLKRQFLMIGRRIDLDMPENWTVGMTGWDESLRAYVSKKGQLHGATGIDYFVFRRGLYRHIPSFAIGRTAWDNWLLADAWLRNAMLIDATDSVMAVHLNHDYNHSRGHDWVWNGPEAVHNRQLAGGACLTLDDATHVLRNGVLRKNKNPIPLRRRVEKICLRYPALTPVIQILRRCWRACRRGRSPR